LYTAPFRTDFVVLAISRKYNLGRATFIIMEEMKAFADNAMKPFKAPGNTSRLFDLVKSDSTYRAAFYYALRDTLVAPNLDVATEFVAKQKKKEFKSLVTHNVDLFV